MNATLTDETVKHRSLGLTAADAVWVATATLHKRHPSAIRFTTDEIAEEVKLQNLTDAKDQTVLQHIRQHCVANRPPQPNRYRMLYALGRGDRRLFLPWDKEDDGRRNAPTKPDIQSLPPTLQPLLQWYEEWIEQHRPKQVEQDPLLALIGSGKHLWKDESGDAFLARLRSNWGGVD